MSILRKPLFMKVMTLVTGLIFLNMSFFLAEVSALKLDQDKQMIGNIAKLIASSSAEEEKDAFGGTDKDASSKEVEFVLDYVVGSVNDHILISKENDVFNPGAPR